jgi:predicted CXXCH cytochrome family protein
MKKLLPLVLAAWLPSCDRPAPADKKPPPTPEAAAAQPAVPPLADANTLASSNTCMECHADAHAAWATSHHALAHRNTGSSMDAIAFADQIVRSGDAEWKFSGAAENPEIEWRDGDHSITGKPPMAIGLTPLVQYLVDIGNGRYQVPDMAWDPAKNEWFSIYENQNRRPDEWGHWRNRGMNWNSMCAYCHFTGLRKNHDLKDDSYHTTWVEQGVGCAQCHGPDRPDARPGECRIAPERQKFTKEQWTHNCATCHARRGEFDEKFITGRSIHDHYTLSLPDQPGLWHPDGQQLDEIYNFNSLMFSRMGHKGIGCTDCHDPHAATPRGGDVAVKANITCMTCHGSGKDGATLIDPAAHSHHAPGTPGASCVDCHMPKRPYMARDPRSDHRFPSPDPLLTRETGVPNACNNCHEDKGLDWQIEWTHRWYGETMNAASRTRTRAIHAAHEDKPGALDGLLAAFDVEEIDAWRATLLRLMLRWAGDSRVVTRANAALENGGPFARAAAARHLGERGETGPLYEKALADPLKAVRLEAAWSSLERLRKNHPVWEEVITVARHQADQPIGAMQMARILHILGKTDEATGWFKRAAEWDLTSPVPRRDFAVFLAGAGRTAESIAWLDQAAALDPQNPEIPYLAALANAELGDTTRAATLLRKATSLDPNYSRAWYNLGLLEAGRDQPAAAIDALLRAERADPTAADPPYARATIHLRTGNPAAARDAAAEALRRDPQHQPAAHLMRELQGR